MDWLDAALSAASMGIGGLGSYLTGQANKEAVQSSNEANLTGLRETNAQNLALTREQWGREDNAVQRRMADMKAAGINPLLAAGGAATSSPAARMEAPHVAPAPDTALGSALGTIPGLMMSMMKGLVDVQQTQAQTELTRLQQGKVSAETTGQELSNQLASSVNPLKKSSMELDVALQTATLPNHIDLVKTALKQADVDVLNSQLDTKLKNLGISTNTQSLINAKQFQQLQIEDLNIKQKEALIKGLTIEALTMTNQQLKEATAYGAGKADALARWKQALGLFGPIVGAGNAER